MLYIYTDELQIFLMSISIVGVSYNLPNVSSCAEWNRNGITLSFESKLESHPFHLFVDKNNTVHVAYGLIGVLYEWNNDSNDPSLRIGFGKEKSMGLFISSKSNIYINDYDHYDFTLVKKWQASNVRFEIVAEFCEYCAVIFININEVLYCSMRTVHQIVTKSLDDNSNRMTIVAGVGIAGSEAHMLNYPRGIFVHTNLDLFVADSENDRIQLFRSGTIHGITIAGTSDTIELYKPNSVVLDANNYIYILDSGNNRIVAETVYGFDCIVSCVKNSASVDKLSSPLSMAFDSFGNLYVSDSGNQRVQKYLLSDKKCGIILCFLRMLTISHYL